MTAQVEARLAYTVPQAADQLGISVDTVRKAIRTGELKAKLVGRKQIIRAADLGAWLSGLPDA